MGLASRYRPRGARSDHVRDYFLNLRPVVDGRIWLEDEGVYWVIDVRG